MHAAGPTVHSVEKGATVPGVVIVGLSILLVCGLGGVAIWTLRRKGSSPGDRLRSDGPQWVPPGLGAEPRDLLLEAELQELIAEERARQVGREAAHIHSGPG